ncbi:hypothetical protein D4764_08G0001440 [Takifugu flavidus]|uniref:Uncharacterized protein n=1 Tax=Takifugu flavidus TaxID=433684 RepID=A0A5C6MS02_9TELE|nr:hypothetical protein D4764_08G0001440 [Takifugu flavidus]
MDPQQRERLMRSLVGSKESKGLFSSSGLVFSLSLIKGINVNVLFNMDDSLAIILLFPTTSTESRGHPRTELALLFLSLSVMLLDQHQGSDYPIKDATTGGCYACGDPLLAPWFCWH